MGNAVTGRIKAQARMKSKLSPLSTHVLGLSSWRTQARTRSTQHSQKKRMGVPQKSDFLVAASQVLTQRVFGKKERISSHTNWSKMPKNTKSVKPIIFEKLSVSNYILANLSLNGFSRSKLNIMSNTFLSSAFGKKVKILVSHSSGNCVGIISNSAIDVKQPKNTPKGGVRDTLNSDSITKIYMILHRLQQLLKVTEARKPMPKLTEATKLVKSLITALPCFVALTTATADGLTIGGKSTMSWVPGSSYNHSKSQYKSLPGLKRSERRSGLHSLLISEGSEKFSWIQSLSGR